MSRIELNPGPQRDFVLNDHRHSAYVGGVGAGKTFALCARGLRYAQQPKAPGHQPPKGCFLTISLPVLKDIVYPAFYKVLELAGVAFHEVKNERKFVLDHNGAEILMRSLDEPDRIRGIEVCWFGIDEGRNFNDDYAYTVMVGRLRQGRDVYKQAGWVCSTPHGYDWMWKRFHPDSAGRLDDTEWYNAPTYDNRKHLGDDYIRDLERQWEGRFFEQEVLGKFVGAVEGAVFDFDPVRHTRPVKYRKDLPLYSFWDFGIGDAGVCLFAQVEWVEKTFPDGTSEQQPYLKVIGHIEMTDATISEWANAFYRWLEKHVEGRQPDLSFGDPAGLQRSMVTGTSVYDALYSHGVVVSPAPKRPKDEAIIILQNLMEGDRFVVDIKQERVIRAVQTYSWKVDHDGQRVGTQPVHNWTSHFCDALQYGAIGLIGLYPRRISRPTEPAKRGTLSYIHDQLFTEPNIEMGHDHSPGRIDWHVDRMVEWDEV